MAPLSDEMRYRLLKLLEDDPNISQRSLAKALGVSLGKTNYCIRAVMERGWVKAKNFVQNENKRVYAYYVTRKGFEEKARVTLRFLKQKIEDHEQLKQEIAQLKTEIRQAGLDRSFPKDGSTPGEGA